MPENFHVELLDKGENMVVYKLVSFNAVGGNKKGTLSTSHASAKKI